MLAAITFKTDEYDRTRFERSTVCVSAPSVNLPPTVLIPVPLRAQFNANINLRY